MSSSLIRDHATKLEYRSRPVVACLLRSLLRVHITSSLNQTTPIQKDGPWWDGTGTQTHFYVETRQSYMFRSNI